MAETLRVSLNISDTLKAIDDAVLGRSITGERIDSYELEAPNGGNCVVRVYEKHYHRAGNRLTLTIVVDDFEGVTRVHSASGGGGEGLFRFDWGASESFASVAYRALAEYRIK